MPKKTYTFGRYLKLFDTDAKVHESETGVGFINLYHRAANKKEIILQFLIRKYGDEFQFKPDFFAGLSRIEFIRRKEKLPVISGRGKRKEIQGNIMGAVSEVMGCVRSEIQALKPMGRRSELGAAIGVVPKKGVCVATPEGELIFAKQRQPSRKQLKHWEEQENRASTIRKMADDFRFDVTICNKFMLKKGEKLLKKRLLDPDEKAHVIRLRKFWKSHPHAKDAVLKGGQVVEWVSLVELPYNNKAATPKRKPPTAKPKKKAATPKAKKPAKNGKPAPAGITLTAAQKKRLAAKGSVTVKRGGKFVTVRE